MLQHIQGRDADNSSARQAGALAQLRGLVNAAHGFQPPAALVQVQVAKAYGNAQAALQRLAIARLDPPSTPRGADSARARWFAAVNRYDSDASLKSKLLQRCCNGQMPTPLAQAQRQRATHAQAVLQELVAPAAGRRDRERGHTRPPGRGAAGAACVHWLLAGA